MDEDPVLREYVWLPGSLSPSGFWELNRYYWIQSDVRGAAICVFDDQGSVAWRAHYDAFGRAQVVTNDVRQPWRLLGQYRDDETGLHYNHARYYSPLLRSYLSRDPNWHLPWAANYSYARQDPWNRVDPFGKVVFLAAAAVAVGAAAVGAIG